MSPTYFMTYIPWETGDKVKDEFILARHGRWHCQYVGCLMIYVFTNNLQTRMHSSRMRSDRGSGHLVGGVCLDTPGQTPPRTDTPPPYHKHV